MRLNHFKYPSIASSLAQATAFKNKGFYAAAKQVVKQQLVQHPHHEGLQILYQHIESLQQKKK